MRVDRCVGSRFILLSFLELDHIVVLSIEWLNFLFRVPIVYRVYKALKCFKDLWSFKEFKGLAAFIEFTEVLEFIEFIGFIG